MSCQMWFGWDYTSAFDLDPFRAGTLVLTSLPSIPTLNPWELCGEGSQSLETWFVTCGACGQGSVVGSAVLG